MSPNHHVKIWIIFLLDNFWVIFLRHLFVNNSFWKKQTPPKKTFFLTLSLTFNFQADFEKEYDIVQKIGEVCAKFFGVKNNNFSHLRML